VNVGLGLQRHQERQVIDTARQARKNRADPAPAPPVLLELERAFHQLARLAGRRLDMPSGIEFFPVPFFQFRLVIERVHLADPAVHEELDHMAGLGRVMLRGGQRVLFSQQLRQGDAAQAAAGAPKKLAPAQRG